MMNQRFVAFQPPYTLTEKVSRVSTIAHATTTIASHLIRGTRTQFAASVEITDRCNAGCHYCYVYQPDWNQQQRLQGYLQLTPDEHSRADTAVPKIESSKPWKPSKQKASFTLP